MVQIMICHLFGPGRYLDQCGIIVNGMLRNKFQLKQFSYTKIDLKILAPKWQPFYLSHNVLTYFGPVMSYGETDLGQHWLR